MKSKWLNANITTPYLNVTGVGLQRERKSDPVIIRVAGGGMGICTYDGEQWALCAKDVCGDIQMVYNYLVDDVVEWREI
tara:strand:+ start:240 stop:476 length:237 start_codon:yes stop_codon:yes gene_type:complete